MTTSVSDPLVGHVLNGRYEILTKLARGGMATVYRARDRRLSRTVAIKVMRTDLGEDPEFKAKFDREARAAATLNHPNVVGVFDQGTENGRPYIVMEFIEGHTLRSNVAREAPMPPDRVLEFAEPIVAALAAAHEAGLVHRDIKPENVLISNRGEVKVADFGLARAVESPNMTATGVLVGTASYLPPELVTKSRPDARSDVYSTGVMLYEMLTGRKPHTGETNYQIAYAHVNSDIAAPSRTLADAGVRVEWAIPDYVDALVRACTRRDPSKRPSDGRGLLRLVRECRRALAAGRLSDPGLASTVASPDSIATETICPVTPNHAPSAPMHPAPTRVDTVWRPRESTARTPRSSSSPSARSPRTPTFPSHISNDPTHRRRRGAALLVAVLLTAVLAGVGTWWYAAGRYTTTPALTNKNQADAQLAAESAGVTLAFEKEYSETIPAALIARSEPGAGTKVVKGSVITVWISQGPQRVLMPPVTGLTKDDAQAAIRKTNLALGTVTEEYSETVETGRVIGASQAKDTKLKLDTPINLVVSKGPRPIPVTNFAGQDAAVSIKKLEEAGFVVKRTDENHKTVPAGSIISQAPATGTGKKGDAVTIVVSKGPVMVAIPKIKYDSRKTAISKLENAGFTVVVKESGGVFRLNIAAGTTPAEGVPAPEGSTVTLHVV